MLNIIAGTLSTGAPPVAPSSYESIATVTVGSGGAGEVEFTSIPSTYTHLQIRGITRFTRTADSTGSLFMRFNGDTGSNYSFHQLYTYGFDSSPNVDSGASVSYMSPSFIPSDFNSASIYGAVVIDILEYKNTNTYKTMRALGGFDPNSIYGSNVFASSNWRNTNAITSIKLYPNVNVFNQYTQFALYGIKGV